MNFIKRFFLRRKIRKSLEPTVKGICNIYEVGDDNKDLLKIELGEQEIKIRRLVEFTEAWRNEKVINDYPEVKNVIDQLDKLVASERLNSNINVNIDDLILQEKYEKHMQRMGEVKK